MDNYLLIEKTYCIKTTANMQVNKCYNGIILWTVHGYCEYRTFDNITKTS